MPFTRRSPVSLDGSWGLELLDVPGPPRTAPAQVEVPGAWTLQVPGCATAHGAVRYSRTFRVPPAWPADGVVLLRFGAVNHAAEVLVNGRCIGGHEGGWTPFEVVVPADLLTGGDERLEVVVSYPPLLPADRATRACRRCRTASRPGTAAAPASGSRWRSNTAPGATWCAPGSARTPRRVGCASRAVLAGPVGAAEEVVVTVRERTPAGDGPVVARAVGGPDLTAVVPEPRLWSPDAPHLYDVHVELRDQDAPVDAVVVTTGLRTVTTRDGEVLLNGRADRAARGPRPGLPPGQRVALADVAELEALFAAARRLGFTLLRCHIKRPDPVYFELADRMGLLVWAELPSWQRFTPRAAAAAESLLEEMIDLDGHHPSIVTWTVVNESWGLDMRDPDQRGWLARTQQRAKELAPDALVVDNSACESNFHVRTDLDDFHAYRGMPERRASWDAWVDEFASRPGGRSAPTATPSAPGRSRWSPRSSATGACRT
jgi:hypothetical protein